MVGPNLTANSRNLLRNIARRGELLPDVSLLSADGAQVRFSDYRGKVNLVLILADHADDENALLLLDEVAGRYAEFTSEEAKVIVILLGRFASRESPPERWEKLPFTIVADVEGEAHRSFGALDLNGTVSPAIFVTDRYGEIYAEFHPHGSQQMPKIDEILQWLSFINSQCPECGVPEWPQ